MSNLRRITRIKTITDDHFNSASVSLRLSNYRRELLSIFSFSEQDTIRGFFTLSIKEITIWNIYSYYELSIQPLRQGSPPQIVASWFLECLKFKGAIVEDLFETVATVFTNHHNGKELILTKITDDGSQFVRFEFEVCMYGTVSLTVFYTNRPEKYFQIEKNGSFTEVVSPSI
jgi:hypothetical protein